MFENKPRKLNKLKQNIKVETASVFEVLCQRVLIMRNLCTRLEEFQEDNGQKLDNIIFIKYFFNDFKLKIKTKLSLNTSYFQFMFISNCTYTF